MFPLNALSRKALRQIRGDAAELRRDFERSAADDIDRPWMKVTGRYSGNGLYAWTMQAIDSDGNFYDHPNGVAGTVSGLNGATQTVLPADEMNGYVVSTFPFYVRGERRMGGGVVGGVRYTFDAPLTSAASTIYHPSTASFTLSSGSKYLTLIGSPTFSVTGPGLWRFDLVASAYLTVNSGGIPSTTPFLVHWVISGGGANAIMYPPSGAAGTTLFPLYETVGAGSGGAFTTSAGWYLDVTSGTASTSVGIVNGGGENDFGPTATAGGGTGYLTMLQIR